MNDSEPHSVPPNEPSPPAPAPIAPPVEGSPSPSTPTPPSSTPPSSAPASPNAAPGPGAPPAGSPAGSPNSGAQKSGAETSGAESSGTESAGTENPGAENSGSDAAASDAGSGEGGGTAEKRRRRRRRRRKDRVEGEPAGTAEGQGEGGGDAASSGGTVDAAGGDADRADRGGGDGANRPKRVRKPRKPKSGRRAGGEGGHGQAQGRGRGQGADRGSDRRGGGRKDSQHSATQAVRALADMANSLLRVEGVDPLAMPRYLELNLRVPLDGGNDVRHAAGTAVEQILQRVREVREHEQALRPGAVYSYFTDSSHAEGCRPTEPRHVFDGYSSTGKPNFADFVTLAIERKDPDVERLLAGEEIVLTHVTMGRVLRTQQLAEFGGQSPVFKILGQVNAGLFRVLNDAGRCAFSFQLLRGATLEGRVRLRLHPVSAVDPMDLADPALMQILTRFQRKLDQEALRLEGQLKNGDVDEEEFVLPLLQDFARQLQTRTRNAGRRTQHGLERSESGQRPTSKAYPDAGEASDGSILWDIDQSTIVVLGPKGRAHVFTPVGKHVTSVVMQRQAIERRRQQGRWRLAEPDERGEFRIQVKRLIAAGDDQPVADSGPEPSAAGGSIAKAIVEKPAAAAPVDKTADKPAEKTADKPAESAADTPAETPPSVAPEAGDRPSGPSGEEQQP